MSAEASELHQRVHRAVTGQSQNTVTILSSLLAVEDEIGYIPPVAVEEVAELTDSTVKRGIRQVLERLGAHNRSEAVSEAHKRGLL